MKDPFFSHNRTEHPDAANFERHCHTQAELLFVLHGRGDFIVEGARYPLRDGTVLLTRPREYHYVRPDADTPYERYVITFDTDFPVIGSEEPPLLSAEGNLGTGVWSASGQVIPHLRHAFSFLDTVLERTATDSTAFDTALRTVTSQALLLLSLQDPDRQSASTDETVSALIDYINRHLTEELTLDRLSQAMFVSKYHLCRRFREYTGMSILTYINTKRIALAAQLLESGTPAQEVAAQVGFGDYSAFWRRFVRILGRSPAELQEGSRRAAQQSRQDRN